MLHKRYPSTRIATALLAALLLPTWLAGAEEAVNASRIGADEQARVGEGIK